MSSTRCRSLLSCVALAGAALALPPALAAQEPLLQWSGTARFSDGEEEQWIVHLRVEEDRLQGDLLFAAGTGAVLEGIERTGGLAFRFAGASASSHIHCRLLGSDVLSGDCVDASGAMALHLTLTPSARGVGPDYRDDGAARPRARDIGLIVGVFPPGPLNAITDVQGVRVGHATIRQGDDIRTGVTAVIPAPGDLYARPVPAWIYSANGYGKLIGETQVREFGEIETPILLTCTLCVWSAARALAWTLMEADSTPEHTINPVVGETNDSWLSDMWADPVSAAHVREALASASSGVVAEGSVGAGTGTTAFGWKGGIGTSSRMLPESLGGWTVGVLVQTNFGGALTMNGAPVGRELGAFTYRSELARPNDAPEPQPEDGGSLMMVVATDAPLDANTLQRLAERAMFGAVRTGSFAHNSSGDYVVAFSTASGVRRERDAASLRVAPSLSNPQMSPLFAAVVEATEEAIYNAMLKASTTRGRGHVYKALPLDSTLDILQKYGVLHWNRTLPR